MGPNGEAPAVEAVDIEAVIWQFGQDYPGAQGDDTLLPVQTVYIKTHDATNWMSTYDEDPMAVAGPNSIRRLIDHYRGQGIEVVAWFVPKGRRRREPALYGEGRAGQRGKGAVRRHRAVRRVLPSGLRLPGARFLVAAEAGAAGSEPGRDLRPAAVDVAGIRDIELAGGRERGAADVLLGALRGPGSLGDPRGCVSQAHSDLGLARAGPGHSSTSRCCRATRRADGSSTRWTQRGRRARRG